MVSTQKKMSTGIEDAKKTELHVYMNHLRQHFITKVPSRISCTETMPYLVLDTDEEENQSRKLFKPIVPNLIGGTLQRSSAMQINADTNMSPNNAPKQQPNTARSNLQQICESMTALPTPESQLSYKPVTPNGPPLPIDLRALNRAKPLN